MINNQLLKILILFCLVFGSDLSVGSEQLPLKITIKSIHLGPITGDSKNVSSTLINFTNEGAAINDWRLGFYMPSSLIKLINGKQHFNPKLVMEICDDQAHCMPLHYENNSQGYTTILAPYTPFPLLHNQSYTINLLYSNQMGGKNFSHFPQNIFFILPNKKIYTADTTKKTYSIANYDQQAIDTAIKQHLETNWINSIPYQKTDNAIDLIPSPVHMQKLDLENFNFGNTIAIHNQLNKDNQIAAMIAKALQNDLSIKSTVDNRAGTGITIEAVANPTEIDNNPEGYILQISANNILIQANTNAGVYYAYQTLRQLWNKPSAKSGLPAITIVDYPRFKYRGILLDTARHFFSVADIKAFIALMGTLKLNTLHLHLADDEAFRLALPAFPSLQTIGAVRSYGFSLGPLVLPQGNLYNDNQYAKADTVYKGSYDARAIAEIIGYANANQITVIPEIDIPAHTMALIKSLPKELIDPNDHSQFASVQGYTDDVLPVCTYNTNISNGQVFTETINTILRDVANLFNGQTTLYAIKNELSVGGDEVSSNAWTEDSSCQHAWKNLSPEQKSHLFFQQLAVANPDIIFSGWQELVSDKISLGENIIPANRTGHIFAWNISFLGIMQAITLANNDYPTVLTYADKTYFDLTYTPDINEPGFNWASQYGDTEAALSSALSATTTINGVTTAKRANVIGIEGALWSENLENFKRLVYMALPKMAGLSEATWAPSSVTQNKTQINWQNLATRLGCGQNGFLAYLSKLYDIQYRGYPHGIKLEIPTDFCS